MFNRILRRFNYFLKNIFPPFFYKCIFKSYLFFYKRKLNYDKRRWWKNEDLFFNNLKFKSLFTNELDDILTVTLNQETKDCLVIKPFKKIKLDFNNEKISLKELIFIFGNKSNFESEELIGSYTVNSLESLIIDIKKPIKKRWINVWVAKDQLGESITIYNNTNIDLYFSFISVKHGREFKSNVKNIILIAIDQLDFNTFSQLNNKNDLPFINNFFKDSISYTNFYAAAEWTIPCITSLISGKYPSYHGRFDLKFMKKVKEDKLIGDSLIQFLKTNNFFTFGISRSKGHHAAYNFHKNFDRFLYFSDNLFKNVMDDEKISRLAIENIDSNLQGNNFLYLHYMSAHSPYYDTRFNEEKFLSRFRFSNSQSEYSDAIIDYGDTKIEPIMDEEKSKNISYRQKQRIKNIDLMLGHLFSYLKMRDLTKNSVIIFTSDHGPNHFGKKNYPMLSYERLCVPLEIYHPNYTNSKIIVDDLISQVDIFNFIKSLIETEKFDYNSFSPFEKHSERKYVISESIFNKKFKIVIRTKEHLYYYCCKFDPENSEISLQTEKINQLYKLNKNNMSLIEDINYMNYFYKILITHISESKILKIKK
jgi:hypothetical protein